MHAEPVPITWQARCKQFAAFVFLVVVFLGGACLPGSFALEAGRQVWQARVSRDWQHTVGTVESSELVFRASAREKRYIPHVVYRYAVAGRTYRSNAIEATPSHTQAQAKKIVADYRPGMAVPVFHDGEGRSILRQGVRAPSWITLVVAGGASLWLVAMLVGILVWARVMRRRARGQGPIHVVVGAAKS